MILSFMLGAFATLSLFIISLLLVVGIKSVYYSLKGYFSKKQPQLEPEIKSNPEKRKPKTIRTIEIDPNIADRIYFKKSS
jgi:hypothetical protein